MIDYGKNGRQVSFEQTSEESPSPNRLQNRLRQSKSMQPFTVGMHSINFAKPGDVPSMKPAVNIDRLNDADTFKRQRALALLGQGNQYVY